MQYDDTHEECVECGHMHYNLTVGEYEPCPLRGEGCTCPFVDGTGTLSDTKETQA